MRRKMILAWLMTLLVAVGSITPTAGALRQTRFAKAAGISEPVELLGKLKVVSKTKSAPAHAMLTLMPPVAFHAPGLPADVQTQVQISPVPGKGLNGATVRVNGLLAQAQPYARCAYGVEGAVIIKLPIAKSVTINKTQAPSQWGDTLELSATVNPPTALQAVTWSSNAPKVATVSETGMVKVLSPGKATITAQTPNGKKARCVVSTRMPVMAISMNRKLTLGIGKSKKLGVTFHPKNADNKQLTWRSTDESVATVTPNGIVTAKGKGLAIIIARSVDGGFETGCLVGVYTPPPKQKIDISWSEDNVKLDYRSGETGQIDAKDVVRQYPQGADFGEVVWVSNNPDIASITPEGFVTAHKPGLFTFTLLFNLNSVCFLSGYVYDGVFPNVPIVGKADEQLTINGKTVRAGMSLAELKALFPIKRKKDSRYFTKEGVFNISANDGIARLEVDGPETVTSRGLSIGDPLQAVYDKYGKPTDIFSSYHSDEYDIIYHKSPEVYETFFAITVNAVTQRVCKIRIDSMKWPGLAMPEVG